MLESLSEVVAVEMRKRNMTTREFAALVGVSHATISRIVSKPGHEQLVSRRTIEKLARALGMDAVTLERLARKRLLRDDDADARMMVELIRGLPKKQRDMVDALLRGFGEQNSKHRP